MRSDDLLAARLGRGSRRIIPGRLLRIWQCGPLSLRRDLANPQSDERLDIGDHPGSECGRDAGSLSGIDSRGEREDRPR